MFYNTSCRFAQKFSTFSSSRWWKTAREKEPDARQFTAFETRSPGNKETYHELARIASNSQQTSFPEHVAGSSG
jgi:hypothetical protein